MYIYVYIGEHVVKCSVCMWFKARLLLLSSLLCNTITIAILPLTIDTDWVAHFRRRLMTSSIVGGRRWGEFNCCNTSPHCSSPPTLASLRPPPCTLQPLPLQLHSCSSVQGDTVYVLRSGRCATD